MKLYVVEGHRLRLDRESDRTDIIGVYSSLEKARAAQDVIGFRDIPKLRSSYDQISISGVELDKMPAEVTARVVWD